MPEANRSSWPRNSGCRLSEDGNQSRVLPHRCPGNDGSISARTNSRASSITPPESGIWAPMAGRCNSATNGRNVWWQHRITLEAGWREGISLSRRSAAVEPRQQGTGLPDMGRRSGAHLRRGGKNWLASNFVNKGQATSALCNGVLTLTDCWSRQERARCSSIGAASGEAPRRGASHRTSPPHTYWTPTGKWFFLLARESTSGRVKLTFYAGEDGAAGDACDLDPIDIRPRSGGTLRRSPTRAF